MPAGLHADWNDCYGLKKSIIHFCTCLLCNVIIRSFAEDKKDTEYLTYLDRSEKLKDTINNNCWKRIAFIRGFKEMAKQLVPRRIRS